MNLEVSFVIFLKKRRSSLQNELSFSSLIFEKANETGHLLIWHKICSNFLLVCPI